VLHPRTVEAISRAREAGIHVLIATGRMFQSVRPYAADAGIDAPVVCYQGAAVVEPASGRFLLHEPIPLELAKEAIAAVVEEGVALNCYVDDEIYVARITEYTRRYVGFQRLKVHEVGDLGAWIEQPPTKLVAIDEPERLDGVEARLKTRFDGRLYIAKSLPEFLEFASPEVTKASGTAFLAAHLGFARERTVAFGDGENDLELLDWAGYSVAVANGHDRVRALADFVCPSAADEGVAEVLEAFLDSRS
jgi:Cof subfamily protein (haloacid dehalogenase superfamily)